MLALLVATGLAAGSCDDLARYARWAREEVVLALARGHIYDGAVAALQGHLRQHGMDAGFPLPIIDRLTAAAISSNEAPEVFAGRTWFACISRELRHWRHVS